MRSLPEKLGALLVLTAAIAGCGAPEPEGGQAATATGGGPELIRDCPECPELVVIPAGTFQMGSTPEETLMAKVPEARARNEHPEVTVTIARPYALGRREVTIAEFRAFAVATGFSTTKGCFGFRDKSWALEPEASWEDPGFAFTDQHPAACVTLSEIQAYLDWLSARTGARYRLPTEAEWEHAARLGTQPVRIWRADDSDACTQFNAADRQFTTQYDENWPSFACDDGFLVTSPAGHFPPNALGMYDVLGNVAELTADCFVAGHAGRPTDASAREDETCNARVFKGGSWAGEPGFLRPAFRVAATPEVRGNGFGVRVLREL